MARPTESDKPKIQMLLDIENIFAESTRGLGQLIVTMCVVLLPPIVIAYTAAYIYIPWQILVVICAVWAVRMTLRIMGNEPARIRDFKKQRDDQFSMTDDMINVRRIHKQGCIEYINGTVMFLLVTYNDSTTGAVRKSMQIDRFLNMAVGKHAFDIYVQNDVSTDQIDNKYQNVTMFGDDEAARAFMEIIDYNREVVSKCSTLTRNIIAVIGSKYQWKEIYNDIQTALTSEAARVFRLCYLATDKDEIDSIISRDINGNVDMEAMMQKRYASGNIKSAKVISYDYSDQVNDEIPEEEQREELVSFIPHA